MLSLNEKIQAYLEVNKIVFTFNDYITEQTGNEPEYISYWNNAVLGPQPTIEQIDAAIPIWDNAQLIAANKVKAKQLLADTDWAATVDINNPQYSNPYLSNQDAFLAYRSAVRAIAVNPPTVVDPWPVQPTPVWQSV